MSKAKTPSRICGDCLHVSACMAWNSGSLYNTDATHCVNWQSAADVRPVKWIPVTERLPEEKDRYLTVSIEPWFGTTVVDTMRWSGVWMYDGRQTEATVTHWMPLPEPPKAEEGE